MSSKYEFFGKFILLDRVAAGGMAEVFRAKAPGAEGIGKILALKRILPQFSSNSEFIDMFKSEAKIAVNLTQANIAQIFEFGEEKNQFFLVMEYIDGRNLRQVLQRCTKLQKALTIEQCVYVISQVANGLDYAHRSIDRNTGNPLNIIHRDMSPQNIMMSFEGEVKIVDFGIAKAESKIENTRAGTLKGKFGYMSPEQAEGLELDSRTDIFSTGIVLWELLSGERLFVANNEINTIRKIKDCQIPSLRKINPNIHEELERISLKALAKDRNLRYQTAAELHRDLSRFLYKVNPEFTQHDLAVTVKNLFKEEILDDRKKIVEYSKVNMPTSIPKEDMSAFGHETKTLTGTEEPAGHGSSQSTTFKNTQKTVPFEKGPKIHEITDGSAVNESNSAFAFNDIERIGAPPPEPKKTSKSHAQAPQGRLSIEKSAANISGSLTARSSEFSRSTSYDSLNYGVTANRPQIDHMGAIKSFGIFALVLSLIGVGYYLFKNPAVMGKVVGIGQTQGGALYQDVVQTIPRLLGHDVSPAETIPVGDVTQNSQAPINGARVLVHSIPAGATIEVDGRPMGTTPGEVVIPFNQQVRIDLKKAGYMNFERFYKAANSPEDFTATLQKENVGYLDIDVRPTGADIYVNGEKILEHPPVMRYAVPADKKIKIRAVNANANTWDEQVVQVRQDTVKSVQLFLKKSK